MSDSDLGAYYFHQGTNFRAYDYLGCTCESCEGRFKYTFRVWAPNADAVWLISDVYGWSSPYPMERVTEKGIYSCVITSDVRLDGMAYKYRIKHGERIFDKGDPFAAYSRGGADGASVIFTDKSFVWEDDDWLKLRKTRICEKNGSYLATPINIYEIHAGSFIRHEDNSYYTYRELADVLIPYIKYMGYTHVEFLPLQEFPYDGSWGYQVCAFYAPTSRFGTPNDFRYLINALHKNGIGIIMDWVPAHFPKDAWGLYEFDGAPLYEYQGDDRKESRSWGTRFFDLGREEVQSFLISNAMYFLREFHIDGLRVDAVASMLYLDYDREPGEWTPNCYGTNISLEAEAFFRKLNSTVFSEMSDALMIAEESTSYGKITHPIHEGGLGFNLKWNMGLANDFYDYVMTDPIHRAGKHTALNFPLMYAYTENYVLPISHDEVVHGKLSFIDKMYGSYEDKFAQARTAMMLYMTYPGKKLLFMGTEYAQFREWDYENSLEWFMLDYPKHKAFRDFVRALNHFYISRKELWELDLLPQGFTWLLADENEKNLVAFRRNAKRGSIIVILSFSGVEQQVTIPIRNKDLKCIFNTGDVGDVASKAHIRRAGGRYYADITVPAFTGLILSDSKRTNKSLKEN